MSGLFRSLQLISRLLDFLAKALHGGLQRLDYFCLVAGRTPLLEFVARLLQSLLQVCQRGPGFLVGAQLRISRASRTGLFDGELRGVAAFRCLISCPAGLLCVGLQGGFSVAQSGLRLLNAGRQSLHQV